MREIKFRAWCEQQKKMFAPFTLKEAIGQDAREHRDEDIFMQYTGLDSKDGVEIYEDDIFDSEKGKWHVKFGEFQCWGGAKLIDVYGWYGECLTIEGKNAHDQKPITQASAKWIEIIGNIHQNPDLLS